MPWPLAARPPLPIAGSSSPADPETQAMSLLLLLRTSAKHQLVPKLAAYVAQPSR